MKVHMHLGSACSECLVKTAKPPRHVPRQIEQHDRILVRHLSKKMMERARRNFNRGHRRECPDTCCPRHRIDHAHFSEESPAMKLREQGGVGTAQMLDHLNIAFRDDEKRMAGSALPN